MDDEGHLPPPSYDGEDTRPTSRKELAGFYAYSFAAEVFVICGLGAFIPITLEDLARASPSAVLASDPTSSCKTKLDIPEIASTLSTYGSSGRNHTNNQCVFRLLGMEINTASFAMYTFSISVLLQAVVVVTMSGAADHGRFRKTMLLTFAVVGAVATMLFLPVTPNAYLLGSLWAIIGNVCFGASFVLLNSFLPLLVRHHPKVLGRSEARAGRLGNSNEVGHITFKYFLGPIASYDECVRCPDQPHCAMKFVFLSVSICYSKPSRVHNVITNRDTVCQHHRRAAHLRLHNTSLTAPRENRAVPSIRSHTT